MIAAAAVVAGPWTWYIWDRFPLEAAGASSYTLQHISAVVEAQQTRWWTYFADLPRFFGELTPVGLALGAAAITAHAAGRAAHVARVDRGALYRVLAQATRLPGYVMIAAPAIFILLAAGVERGRELLPARGPRRAAGQVVLVLMVLLTARFLLEPRGPMEKRDRSPSYARQLERLDDRLQLPDAILFNVPKPIDAMFYTGYTAYQRMPTDAEVKDLRAQGRAVVIYQHAGAPVDIPSHWQVTELREEK